MKSIDETKKKYGKLTVIKQYGSSNGTTWLCQCKCGRTTKVRGGNLRNGSTKSCGCEYPGYKKGHLGRTRYHTVDDKFFHKNTKCGNYWAGFIAADGNIKNNHKVLIVALAIKDEQHLEQLNLDLKSSYTISRNASKWKNGKVHKYCRLYITSKDIVDELFKRYNITPAKSLTLKYPTFDNFTKEDCFIVGYIDGDGYIHKTRRSWDITGTKQFLTGVKKRFKQICGFDGTRLFRPKGKNIWILKVKSEASCILFQHFDKIRNIPKLQRKWNVTHYRKRFNLTC